MSSSKSKSKQTKVQVKVTASPSPSSKTSAKKGGKGLYRSKAKINTHLNTGKRG